LLAVKDVNHIGRRDGRKEMNLETRGGFAQLPSTPEFIGARQAWPYGDGITQSKGKVSKGESIWEVQL